jgi:hypothetical protein
MVPNSPAWLEYWMRQFELMGTGEPHVRFTLEAARAVMNAIPDDAYEDGAERHLVPAGGQRGLERWE